MTHPLVLPDGRWMRDIQSDEDVVRRVVAGEVELFELLVRRHNQRLFRLVRAIVRDDADAEDALQQAYVNAWRHLASFHGDAQFATWLSRIAIRTAGELRAARERRQGFAAPAQESAASEPTSSEEPARDVSRREVARLLEESIDGLPETYRVVFVLRVLEECSTADVARQLELTESAVKVRLFRAREMLREDLLARAVELGSLAETWSIGGERCDRIVRSVFAILSGGAQGSSSR